VAGGEIQHKTDASVEEHSSTAMMRPPPEPVWRVEAYLRLTATTLTLDSIEPHAVTTDGALGFRITPTGAVKATTTGPQTTQLTTHPSTLSKTQPPSTSATITKPLPPSPPTKATQPTQPTLQPTQPTQPAIGIHKQFTATPKAPPTTIAETTTTQATMLRAKTTAPLIPATSPTPAESVARAKPRTSLQDIADARSRAACQTQGQGQALMQMGDEHEAVPSAKQTAAKGRLAKWAAPMVRPKPIAPTPNPALVAQ
jgi:hypothetical protein